MSDPNYQLSAEQLAAEIVGLRAAMRQVLIGGNELAVALVELFGADFSTVIPYTMPFGEARNFCRSMLHYELWLAWASIMRSRDAVEAPPHALVREMLAARELAEAAESSASKSAVLVSCCVNIGDFDDAMIPYQARMELALRAYRVARDVPA